MNELSLREIVRQALNKYSALTEQAIRNQLVKSFDLGHNGRLHFEMDPAQYGIDLIQTEQCVLFDPEIPDEFFEQAELVGLDPFSMVCEELVLWFADRWQVAGGPAKFSPAYAFFHAGHAHQFDLEKRCWCSSQEVWPEVP